MTRPLPALSLLLLSLTAIACAPEGPTDLEIVEVSPVAPPPWPFGDSALLEVRVRNNGPAEAVTIAAAISGETDSGLLVKGPAAEISRGETATLELEVPLRRPYVWRCRLQTNVFLARPGEPGNVFSDLWTDPAPGNNSRDIDYPVDRAVPMGFNASGVLSEVVEPAGQDVFRRHYEGTVTVDPSDAAWAIDRVLVQTRDPRSRPVELLHGDVLDGRLTTESVIWDDDATLRDSVAQALLIAEARDCEGETITLRDPAVAVVLEPR